LNPYFLSVPQFQLHLSIPSDRWHLLLLWLPLNLSDLQLLSHLSIPSDRWHLLLLWLPLNLSDLQLPLLPSTQSGRMRLVFLSHRLNPLDHLFLWHPWIPSDRMRHLYQLLLSILSVRQLPLHLLILSDRLHPVVRWRLLTRSDRWHLLLLLIQ
jgi:hypothetical protein